MRTKQFLTDRLTHQQIKPTLTDRLTQTYKTVSYRQMSLMDTLAEKQFLTDKLQKLSYRKMDTHAYCHQQKKPTLTDTLTQTYKTVFYRQTNIRADETVSYRKKDKHSDRTFSYRRTEKTAYSFLQTD